MFNDGVRYAMLKVFYKASAEPDDGAMPKAYDLISAISEQKCCGPSLEIRVNHRVRRLAA